MKAVGKRGGFVLGSSAQKTWSGGRSLQCKFWLAIKNWGGGVHKIGKGASGEGNWQCLEMPISHCQTFVIVEHHTANVPSGSEIGLTRAESAARQHQREGILGEWGARRR